MGSRIKAVLPIIIGPPLKPGVLEHRRLSLFSFDPL
jgi:hypothetical protein